MSAAARSSRGTHAPTTPRREATSAPAPAEPQYELVDIDRYVVLSDGPVGYVEVIPPLFICYSGHPYPRAVEIAQMFEFEQAVRRVLDSAPRHQGAGPHGYGLSAA
ncbi:hypothetical protein [Microbacterium sp. USHLN186]|uniref:hypothetical protein n=1 Tax=Microbacterium sp. USHLN186 TaxID=3081286 RepID=UPI0030178952